MNRYSRDQMAQHVARDIPEGAYVNLGIGMPTLVANHIPKDREIVLQSENGLLGMGPAPQAGDEDYDLINAGKQPVTLMPGASFFHHADSFQVAVNGDLANWHTGDADAIPAVGGAMDLASGAKQVFVMMEHLTKKGESKIVTRCSYPLTGLACVSRVYTDLATIHITPQGLLVDDLVEGLSLEALIKLSGISMQARLT
jgi:3-oxoadipate CoA-transferase beta subunit